jgi:CRISPR-associated exonuclease Cas4
MEWISAGDIEKYAYCPLSWWLSQQTDRVDDRSGLVSQDAFINELEDIHHKEIRQQFYNRIIVGLAAAASIIAVIGLVLFTGIGGSANRYIFVAISLIWLLNSGFYLYKSEKMSLDILRKRYEKLILISSMGAILIALVVIFSAVPDSQNLAKFLEILAVIWIVIANLIFYQSIGSSERLLMKKLRYLPGEDTIAYIGKRQESPMLESKCYGLRGRPDYIIEHDGRFVPVEKKAGRTPKGPLFSHIAQLITYCILVEEAFGPLDYGLLEYDQKKYLINYDEKTKKTILALRDALLENQQQGEFHRNHNRKGKCFNCSRRNQCPERLE